MTAPMTTHLAPAPTEASLKTLDILGFIVGALITLGPLAATAILPH